MNPLNPIGYREAPFRFINREYLIITYKSDPKAIRAAVPSPLEPDGSNEVHFEFIRMPDSSGFGDYVESGIVIPCLFKGEKVNFTSQMYLDCLPPIVAGREIWGFPKKLGYPKLEIDSDTLVGTLRYGKQQIALGTMQYKNKNLLTPGNTFASKISQTQVNLKVIPAADGSCAISELVAYNLTDVTVKEAWQGDARLHLIPHINAPIADLPVLEVVNGLHFIADLTLPYGRVLHNYLNGKKE